MLNDLSEKTYLVCILESIKHLSQFKLFQECLNSFLSSSLGSTIKLSIHSSAILDKDTKSSHGEEQGGKKTIASLCLWKITNRKLQFEFHEGLVRASETTTALQNRKGIHRLLNKCWLLWKHLRLCMAFWSWQCPVPWPCSRRKSKNLVQLNADLGKQ